MFTVTVSMWLGITFLLLAIVAVSLQAWLWGPRFWDDVNRRTRAPRAWLRTHAVVGYAYALIYFFMMWHMLPRLWEYQYELPARTIFHAVVAILIGVLLISKLAILRFFRHFEEAMPKFGFGLLACTVVLITLSVPYAVRAHDLGGDTASPENLERVNRHLADIGLEGDPSVEELASEKGLDRGRQVLVTKCTSCHDMRTILIKPRTAARWHDVSMRMLEKPAVFGERLEQEDIPWVTAYLVAITPDIQKSVKRQREERAQTREQAEEVGLAVHLADDFHAPALSDADAKALVEDRCTECHDLEEVTAYGGADEAQWRSVVASMVEEGAELGDNEVVQIARYLAKQYPPSSDEGPAPDSPPPSASEIPDATRPSPKHAEDAAPPEPEPDKTPQPTKRRSKRPKTGAASDALPTSPEKEDRSAAATEAGEPEPDRGLGREVFTKKCTTCHGSDGKGQTSYGQKIGAPDLTRSTLSRSRTRNVIANGRSGTKMRGYGGKLSAEELAAVAAFVRGL